MRSVSIWAASAPIVLGGLVVGAALEPRADCSSLATTTIFVPTTVYVTAPGSPAPSNTVSTTQSRSRSDDDDNNTVSSNSASGTSSGVGATTASSSSDGETASSGVTLSTSSSTIDGPTSTVPTSGGVTSGTSASVSQTTQVPTSDPATSSITSSTISSSVTTSSAPSTPTVKPPGTPSPPPIFRGFKNAIYFTNWGTSGNNSYQPQQLPVSELTHILYAFADIDANGTVKSSDPFADVGKRYALDDNDSSDSSSHSNNAYGAVKQLYLHKKRHRHLKTLLSIGGFDFSPRFAPAAATEGGRRAFAASAVRLMADYGFDGLDLDWEYPADAAQARDLVLLLRACREALDRFAFQHRLLPYRFLLTVASPAGPVNSHTLDLAGMDPYVDIWNLMAYDYTGQWDNTTGHQSNLYRSPRTPRATKFSTDDAVRYYAGLGVRPDKLLIGVPTYGRSFASTSGLGEAYAGSDNGGAPLYKTLPRPGARELWDDGAKAAWSYDNKTRELVSYDTPRSVLYKARYVRRQRLGGAFFWEARGDRAGAGSLVRTMARSLGWLDESRNNLWYPTSRYENIRRGMPGA